MSIRSRPLPRQLPGSWATGGAAAVFSLVAVGAAQVLSLRALLLDTDEATYASVAALMNAGGALYSDGGIDNKPPVIFWTYAGVFRSTGLYNMFAVHALKIGVVLATALVVFFIARRRAGNHAGAIAFVLYGVFTVAGYPPMAAANTEVFMMLPVALAVLSAGASVWWLAGTMIAVAAFTKQTAVLDLMVLVAATTALSDMRRFWQATAAWVAGFAAACAVVLAGLWWQHSAFGFWRWAILSLPGYGTNAWLAHRWVGLFQTSVQPWLLAVPLLWVPTALALVRKVVTRSGGDRILWAWLVVGCVQVVSSGQFFGHYFIAVVGPLSVLAAIEIDTWLRGGRAQALAGAAGVLVLILPALSTIAGNYRDRGQLSPESVQVGQYVKAHTLPSDRILVYGNDPTLYVASDRLPSTSMVGFLRGYPRGALGGAGVAPRSWDTAPDAWAQFDEDQANHPPALILDVSTRDADFRDYQLADTFPSLARTVHDHYRKVAVIAGVTIYGRIPDAGGASADALALQETA